MQKVFVGCGKIFLGNCKKELYIWEEVYIMKKNKKADCTKKVDNKTNIELRRRKWENILEQMDFVARQIKF